MIKLRKGKIPDVLTKNADAWTKLLLDKIAKGEEISSAERTRYRHPEIKQALITETHGKCAYCESKLLHIHHGDVEHISPKSLEPERFVDWENLTLACEICNQNKSDKDPKAENILDPYKNEPMDHIFFYGALVCSYGTNEGTCTRVYLGLNRGALAEQRQAHLEALMDILDRVRDESLPIVTRRAIYADFKDRYLGNNAPYAAMARALAKYMEETIPSDIRGNK